MLDGGGTVWSTDAGERPGRRSRLPVGGVALARACRTTRPLNHIRATDRVDRPARQPRAHARRAARGRDHRGLGRAARARARATSSSRRSRRPRPLALGLTVREAGSRNGGGADEHVVAPSLPAACVVRPVGLETLREVSVDGEDRRHPPKPTNGGAWESSTRPPREVLPQIVEDAFVIARWLFANRSANRSARVRRRQVRCLLGCSSEHTERLRQPSRSRRSSGSHTATALVVKGNPKPDEARRAGGSSVRLWRATESAPSACASWGDARDAGRPRLQASIGVERGERGLVNGLRCGRCSA